MKKIYTLLVLWMAAGAVLADPITGVQPASLDQPRIFLQVRRGPGGPALSVKVEKEQTAAIEAFLDTGASGIVIADSTAKALKLKSEQMGGKKATYEDVGVGGSEEFGVSEPLWISVAPYSSNTDGDNDADYSRPIGPMRTQLKPGGGLLDMLTGGMDILGMPGMQGRVIVMDCRPVAKMDKIKTSLVMAGDRSIPATARTVPLTYVSFARFTRVAPAGAAGPVMAANPMIGPDPFKAGDRSSAVAGTYKGKAVRMTMLLDTGAACSMISVKKAAELGITYAADGTTLMGVPAKEQFSLDVGGIGGTKKSTGFYLDLLTLPAKSGEPIVYAKAPMLVSDVTVVDPKTKQSFTLDGVFGMNFLVASANISGGLLPDVDKVVDGPFQFVVVDHARAILGVK
jgi:hypothetical protein